MLPLELVVWVSVSHGRLMLAFFVTGLKLAAVPACSRLHVLLVSVAPRVFSHTWTHRGWKQNELFLLTPVRADILGYLQVQEPMQLI